MCLFHISFSFCSKLIVWLLKLLTLKDLLLCLEILKLWNTECSWHLHFDFQFCCHFDGILFELHKLVHFLLMVILMMGQLLLRFSLLLLLDFRLAFFVALLNLCFDSLFLDFILYSLQSFIFLLLSIILFIQLSLYLLLLCSQNVVCSLFDFDLIVLVLIFFVHFTFSFQSFLLLLFDSRLFLLLKQFSIYFFIVFLHDLQLQELLLHFIHFTNWLLCRWSHHSIMKSGLSIINLF
jgi:hypothetical protein